MNVPSVLKAKDLALRAFHGRLDDGGVPYWKHLEHVASGVAHLGAAYEIVGWLHDLVEDIPEYDILYVRANFGDEVADAVDAITKRKGEGYSDYLLRVKANKIAREVKKVDIAHNSDPARLPYDRSKDDYVAKRMAKYRMALEFLNSDER